MQTSAETHSTIESSVDSVLGALMSVGRLMRQRVGGDAMDPGSFWLLKTLSSRGPMRVTGLAGCANLDTSTISRHVTQLERSGLIERTRDPDDRRAQLVELSADGRERLHQAMAYRRGVLAKSLEAWPQEDIVELDRLLGRFVATIDTLNSDLENA
jgi:DNA-binding MarR family transcriptional regulator